MRIFISYGHDFQAEAKKIVECLKKFGHEVWIDYDGLSAGDDWRDKITEAIIKSDFVLALLSAYGLRKEGVCLDELAIALSCNRRNIRPVKMERDVQRLVPPAIAGIQLFDFSECRDIPPKQVDIWFDKKTEELVKVCFTQHIEYENKIQDIKNRLHYSPKFSRELFELGKDFQKRNWLDKKLSDWIERDDRRLCLLVGFPGFGKSCYCANYYHYKNEVSGLVFCDNSRANAVGDAIREISFQLAVRIPSFATRLEHILNEGCLSIDSLSNEGLFDYLLIEPFNIIDGNMENVIVLVDGIECLSVGGENELFNLFYENVDLFPKYLKILFTARQDISVLAGKSAVYRIMIDPKEPSIFDDIKEFVSKALSPLYSAANEIGMEVAKAAHGSFLYATIVKDGLKSGIIDPKDIGVLPGKIADMYFKWFKQTMTTEEFSEKFYSAVSLVVALENPPLAFLKKALHWRQPQLQLFLERFSTILIKNIDRTGNLCVSFYSDSLAEWIKSEELAVGYAVCEEDGYDIATDYFQDAYELDELKDYDCINLVRIVRKSGRKKLLAKLSEDCAFYEQSLALADELQKNSEYFYEWTAVLDGLDFLFSMSAPNEQLAGRIEYLKAKGRFVIGDLIKCGEIIEAYLPKIEKCGKKEDYFESLFMLGTVCDYKGERERSVKSFEKLYILAKEDPIYSIKALEGLIWNDHFNDIKEGMERIRILLEVELSGELTVLRDLIYARMLLSEGKIDEAVLLYERILETEDKSLWSSDIVARKNQMLLIESVVAAYDAGDIPRAIDYGERIYSKLKGTAGIHECYCLSWLSMSYDKGEQKEKAHKYLEEAKRIMSVNKRSSSLWLEMHLASIEAKYLREEGDGRKSLEKYKDVEKMAEHCHDIWVRGDACFDIISIWFNLGSLSNEIIGYVNTLFELAEQSQLPHLLFKAKIVRCLMADSAEANVLIRELEEIPKLPCVDIKPIAKIMKKKAIAIGYERAFVFDKY